MSRNTVYVIKRKFFVDGLRGLEDHKPGLLRIPVNPQFYATLINVSEKKDQQRLINTINQFLDIYQEELKKKIT